MNDQDEEPKRLASAQELRDKQLLHAEELEKKRLLHVEDLRRKRADQLQEFIASDAFLNVARDLQTRLLDSRSIKYCYEFCPEPFMSEALVSEFTRLGFRAREIFEPEANCRCGYGCTCEERFVVIEWPIDSGNTT